MCVCMVHVYVLWELHIHSFQGAVMMIYNTHANVAHKNVQIFINTPIANKLSVTSVSPS